MINTSKYEGHTPAPWELSPDDWVWAEHLFMQDDTTNFGNAMLITDAPLRLGFIKWVKDTHPHYYHVLMEGYQKSVERKIVKQNDSMQ